MIAISVVVITLNEEKNLARCLNAVKSIVDEIIVVDSFSKDKTVTIAESFGARVIQQDFINFAAQKQSADTLAKNDWILSLDADEVLTPALIAAIREIKNEQQPKLEAYNLDRITNYCGTWIKHCGWYPDKKTRFYNRTKGSWRGDGLHEYWALNDTTAQVGQLKGELQHYSYYTYSDHLRQIDKYTEMAAQIAVKNGKNVSFLKWLLVPKFRFFVDYIIRAGFLDGANGFMVCKLSALATFMKYSKIRQMHKLKLNKQ